MMASPTPEHAQELDLEFLEGSFIFLGPGELLTATKNVEEGDTFISRSRDKPVQCSDAPREFLDIFPFLRGTHVEDGLDFLRIRRYSSLTRHEA